MTTQTTEPRPMKPYLINAVLDYCRDTGTTPYVMVAVDHACRVPQEYVLVPLNRIIAVTPLECQQFALHFEVTETPVEEPEEAPAQPAPGVRRPMRVK